MKYNHIQVRREALKQKGINDIDRNNIFPLHDLFRKVPRKSEYSCLIVGYEHLVYPVIIGLSVPNVFNILVINNKWELENFGKNILPVANRLQSKKRNLKVDVALNKLSDLLSDNVPSNKFNFIFINIEEYKYDSGLNNHYDLLEKVKLLLQEGGVVILDGCRNFSDIKRLGINKYKEMSSKSSLIVVDKNDIIIAEEEKEEEKDIVKKKGRPKKIDDKNTK